MAEHKILGDRIRLLRINHGIGTQRELARLLNVKQQTVSRWEAGTSRPRADELPRLAALLKVKPFELSVAAGYGSSSEAIPFDRLLPLTALSADSFESFTTDLLSALHQGRATVHRVGKTGHKQNGIDIEARFSDGEVVTYQCKREAQFGPAKVRAAIKAQTVSANRKYILLARVASPESRVAVRDVPSWDILDQMDITREFRKLPRLEQVRIVDIYFPNQRFALTGESEPGPWLTTEEFFAPHLVAGRIFNHRWKLVGRTVELANLEAALESADVAVVSLVGRAGEGKSRVLRAALESFEVNHSMVVRVASPSEEVNTKAFEDLGSGKKLIVVDDAHDRTDTSNFLRYVADERNEAKLLLVYRPYWTDVVHRELSRVGLSGEQTPSIVLTKPTKQDAVTLALQVLAQLGSATHAASTIAELAYDSPLAVVVGAHIVAKEGIHPELFGKSQKFQAAVLKHYERVIAEDIATGKDQDRIYSMLRIIALVQPVVPDDKQMLELFSNIGGVDVVDATRLSRLLIDSGVLFKRGTQYRLSPDLLADSIIETHCITSVGDSNGFAERVFEAAISEYKEHVLLNLGRLDWRRSDGDTSSSRLLDAFWSTLAWQDAYPNTQVKAAAAAAYYQPRQALAFARRLIDEGHGGDEDVCAIIRNAAYTLRYVPKACELLWELGQHDRRATNQHPSHPIRLLTELATPEPRKPVAFMELTVDFAVSLIDVPDAWTGTFTPFDILKGAMATEGDFTSSANNRRITFSKFAVEKAKVAHLRERILAILFACFDTEPQRRAFLAAALLGDTIRGPIGARPETAEMWNEEFTATLQRLDVGLQSLSVRPPVLVRIAESVRWHATFGPEQMHPYARRVLDRLDRDLETRTTRAMMDGWGTNTYELNAVSRRDQLDADLERLCRDLALQLPVAENLAEFIGERLADIERASGSAHYGAPQLFLGRLLTANLSLARHVIDLRLADSRSLLAAYAGRALGALLTSGNEVGTQIVATLLDGDNEHLPLIAEAYLTSTHPSTYTDIDLRALRRIFGSKETAVLRLAPQIALDVARRDTALAIDLLCGADIELATQATPDFFVWLVDDQTIPFEQIGDDQLRLLVDGLRNVASLDEHWVNAFLKKAIRRVPRAVLDLAIARVDDAIEKDSWAMQPLGTVFDDRDGLDLLSIDEGPALLRNLLDWARARIADYRFSTRFADMIRSLCAPYSAACMAIVEQWIDMGRTADHFKVVAAMIREAGPSFLFEHSDFIGRSLHIARSIGRKVHAELTGALQVTAWTGVRSGTPGQPFEIDVRLRDHADQCLAELTPSDPAYELYTSIRDNAQRDIDRQVAEGERMDEEDNERQLG